jgi:hypothetical protein
LQLTWVNVQVHAPIAFETYVVDVEVDGKHVKQARRTAIVSAPQLS